MFKIFFDRFRTRHVVPSQPHPHPEVTATSQRTASVEEIWSTWRYEKSVAQSVREARQKSARRAEEVNRLKRIGEYEKALQATLSEIKREEQDGGPRIVGEQAKIPWYYWEAVTICHQLKRYDEEIAIVRRFARNYDINFRVFSKRYRTTAGTRDAWAAKFLERVETAKAAAAARDHGDG